MEEQSRLVSYRQGENIFRRGDSIYSVYLVCQGTVIISSAGINGDEMGVVFVQAGSTVGEMEVLADIKHLVYSAKAYTECVLYEIPSRAFQDWLDCDIGMCRKLILVLAQKLYRSSSTTARYQHYEAAMRVKMFLAEKGVGRVKDTRSALAEACGVSERTINRAVASLEKDGYISINRGKIEISQQQLIMIQLSILEEE